MISLRDPEQGKKAALSSIYDSAGLQVIIDLMEDACTTSENDLIGETPWSESILAKQAVVYAQRDFFFKVIEAIDLHVAEARQTEVQDTMAKRQRK